MKFALEDRPAITSKTGRNVLRRNKLQPQCFPHRQSDLIESASPQSTKELLIGAIDFANSASSKDSTAGTFVTID
jgi:hypothetical protein